MTVREEELCTRIEAWLKQKGIAVQREVVCGNGIRADLVTPDTVIEVKTYLNRGNLYQAHGQGTTYQKLLNKPKLMIIGLAPTSDAKYREAQRIAENIRSKTVEVIFLDKDPRWAVAVKLPFEQGIKPRLEQRTRAEKTKASRTTPSSVKPLAPTPSPIPLLNIRNIGALLLSLLIFLWLRATIWQQFLPVIRQMQLNPEPAPEWQAPASPPP